MTGRPTPPTNLINNMSLTFDRLSTKSSYNLFVKNLVEFSHYDVNKNYKEQIPKLEAEPIAIKPVFATDYNETKGFLIYLENSNGKKIEHKLYFSDPSLNRIMFEKPELLINKEGASGKVLRFLNWSTKLYSKSITLRPFAFSKIMFRSIGEELSLINNNQNNRIFKNLEVAQAKILSDIFKNGNIYIQSLKAVTELNKGNNEKALKIINDYSLDTINSDIFTAVKHNQYEGITSKYTKFLEKDEDFSIDFSQVEFEKKGWLDQISDVYGYGEKIIRCAITKALVNFGFDYQYATEIQRKAVNMENASHSKFAQWRNLSIPFAKSISASAYNNFRSIKKNPKGFIYNIGNKAFKLMMLEAMVQYGLNPLINEVASVFTGKKEDYEIPDKYYNWGIPIYIPYGGGRIIVIPYGFGLANIYGLATEFINRPIRHKLLQKDGYNINQLKDNVYDLINIFTSELNIMGQTELFNSDINSKTIGQKVIASVSPVILRGLIVDPALGLDRFGNRLDRMSVYAKDNTMFLTKKATDIINNIMGTEYSYRTIENIISYIPVLNDIESSLKKGEKDGFAAGLANSIGLSDGTLSFRTKDKIINDKFYDFRRKYQTEFEVADKPIAEFKNYKNKINLKVYRLIKNYNNVVASISSIKSKDKEKEIHKKAQLIIKQREKLINRLNKIQN